MSKCVFAGWVFALTLGSASADWSLPEIETAVVAAVAKKQCPGAVVVVVHKDAVVYRRAFGLRSTADAVPMTPDTIFDLASLTKPVATATAVMTLIESGRLSPSDPVAKHWPAFAQNGKQTVTVEHCLVHTSGLTADNALSDYTTDRATALANVAGLKLEAPPGTRFKYSDVGFIVLGELVEKITGQPLDVYAQKTVFAPLKMTDTGFRPADRLKPRIAPSGVREKLPIVGTVHDPRAFALGGVAGHAGLFGTADDLTRYVRMLLRGGELDGVRILKPETVKLFTTGREVPPKGLRSFGWDVDTGFSAPRGEAFGTKTGFGHTGFTGTSVWVDPPTGTAVILLTNRLHPDEKGNVTELRKRIGTVVGEQAKRH